MWTPEEFAGDFKRRWEGGLSLDRADPGNWVGRKLIGSKYGVTAAALAKYRKVPVTSITANDMAALTFHEAGQVALHAGYYYGTWIAELPWGRLPAMCFDFAYNAGLSRPARALQAALGVAVDSHVGANTKVAYLKALAQPDGEEKLAKAFIRERLEFYQSLKNPKYINGWTNRAKYFGPDHPENWWDRFGNG